ncbi:MAG: hypothetical protein ACPL1Y_07810 [Thermoplasmata archaeon]
MYPEEVITISKKGAKEARVLLDAGRFFRYKYVNIDTGKSDEKVKIVLMNEEGICEEYFIVPVKGGKFLLLPQDYKGKRKVWNGKASVEIP